MSRILIVEDDPDILQTVARLLEASGHTVLRARNGREGLAQAQKEQPDLVLTDLMLPFLSGYEICTMLKQDVRYQKIQVIVWSATKIRETDAQLAKDCGADDFIVKTASPREMVARINAHLGWSAPTKTSTGPSAT